MGDAGYSLCESPGPRILACGYTESGGFGASDLWLLEIDPSGDTLSTRVYGGPADDQGNWILPVPDSGYVICGTTGSFGQGGKDIWLLRTAADTLAVLERREKRTRYLTAYPNPFRTSTKTSIGHSAKSIELKIYNPVGCLVRSFTLGPGLSALCWEGTDQSGHAVPPGVYFMVVGGGGSIETTKIVLLRGRD
jgi:hypothetical protein